MFNIILGFHHKNVFGSNCSLLLQQYFINPIVIQMSERKDLQAYPETNLSNQLLLHQREMLQFLFYTNYDIVYETFQLKHGSYSQRNRGHMITAFKSQEIAKNFRVVSEKLHLRILRDDIDLDKHLGKLELLWHNRNTPYFHRYYFEKYLLSAYFQTIPASITKEEELIKNEEHIYYSLFKSINAREACLRTLKKLLADLKAEDVYEYLHVSKQRIFNERRKNQRQKYRAQGYKLKLHEQTSQGKMSKTKFQLFSDCFNHLTKLTLYVLQLIIKWKEYIANLTHDIRKQKERMEYYFYDDNYLLKILTDLGFLRVSFLKDFYSFAPKNDPFLLECVLGFEKRPQKTVEHELLKLIFMPQKEHLAQILSKLEILSEQYRYNIRSRKVFDINILKKPILRAEEKQLNNQQKEEVSNLVLKKIQSPLLQKKAKSVSTFRVRQTSGSKPKKQQILIEFNKKESPLRKKLAAMPAAEDKHIIDLEKDSPLKNSIILQKNQNSVGTPSVDMNLLNMLKAEVIRKVKEDFHFDPKAKSHENQALEVYIDNKVKETMKSIFPFEPEKQVRQPIEFSLISIEQANLGNEIEDIFKQAIPEYSEMQYGSADLLKLIENAPYVYIIDASLGGQIIGRVICSLERNVQEFKTIRVLYVHFTDLSELDFLMVEAVRYLWKFQNAFEVHFNFFQPTSHEPIQLLLQGLENTLQKECLFGRKQLYSTVMEVKLIFKRPNKNVNFLPNRYPASFHLEFSLLLARKKLMLQNRNQHKHLQLLDYDYFLMQVMRRILTAQDIIYLKEHVTWKERLRHLLELVQQEEQGELMSEAIKQFEASNISQLNNTLTKIKHPFLEVSDLVKTNQLNLLSYSITLTPNYPVKSLYRTNHQQYYRFTLQTKTIVKIDEQGAEFYYLQANQTKDFQLVVFNARNYLTLAKEPDTWLSLYLSSRLSANLHGIRQFQRYIDHFWLPMSRFPHKFKDREEMFYHTSRVLDLAHLKTDLLIGEKMEFFCSMQMENSIKYARLDTDVVLQNPFGLALVAVPSNTVVYARIFH